LNATNPCSEFSFLDDTACNLSSLNLMQFLRPDKTFDTDSYKHGVETMILAQEIIVDNASYPTATIERNSHDYRPLGLGYANLGDIMEPHRTIWEECYPRGAEYGYRNSQVTVIAPTGTIAFMMDCDTTGIEPDIALVKYKKLSGGGMLKIVNNTVPEALRRLGHPEPQVSEILQYIDENDTIEGAPHLRADDLAVFDCAFKPA